MKKWIFTLFLGMIISTSCKNSGSPDKNANASLPYQIDLEQRLKNVRSVDLDILGNNLEYVLLETNPECMLKRIAKVSLSDSFIYVSDGSRMMLFDRTGKFIRPIGANGRGPDEYMSARDFIIDEIKREIYTLPIPV